MEAVFNISIPEAIATISTLKDDPKHRSKLGEVEIIERATERIIAMHLCDDIMKRNNAPKPNSIEFNTALIKEMTRIGRPALQYLIESDLNKEMNTKLSIGIVTLFSLSIIKPKWLEWVRQHEDTMFAASLAFVPDSELERRFLTYMKNPKGSGGYLKLATREEILKYPDHLNPTEKYIKVHFAAITDKLSKLIIADCVVDNGFFYLEYNAYLRDIVTHIVQLELKVVWHAYNIDNINALVSLFTPGIIEKIEIILYDKHQQRIAAEEVYDYPIKLPELPQMAEKYFPPCMTTMMMRFTQDRQLKHDARKQLTLFLKDIGLKKTEILDLYNKIYDGHPKRLEVCNYMKHLVGLSGSYSTYDGYNCKQIQEYNPPLDYEQCHGCYFKIQSERQMKFDFTKQSFTPENIQTIFDLRKKSGPSAACAEHLRLRHNLGKLPREIFKPTDYYNMARCGLGSSDVDIEDLVRLDPGIVQAINEEDWDVELFEEEVNQIEKKSKQV